MSDASNSNQKSRQIFKHKPFGLEIWNSSRICEYVDERELTSRREVISHRDLLQLARNAAKFVWVRYAWARLNSKLSVENFSSHDAILEICFVHRRESRLASIGLIPLGAFDPESEKKRQSEFYEEFHRHWDKLLALNTR